MASSTVPTRTIGGVAGSKLGFGCMSLSPGFYGAAGIDPVEAEKTLRRALDLGITVLNTADFYGAGHNIELIGKVLKDYPRDRAVITMKWGPKLTKEGKFLPLDLSPQECRERVEHACQVLGVDHIDFLVYRQAPHGEGKVSLEETAQGMKAMMKSGKVKAIGVSEVTPEQLRTIHSVVPVSIIELEWSLFARECEDDMVTLARSIGAGFLAYSPLGRGMLTGGFDVAKLDENDFRKMHSPRFQGEAYEHNIALAKKVAQMAEAKGCTAGQLALAWVLAQGDDVIPIPGTKRVKYLEENVKSLEVLLSEAELKELSALVPKDSVKGDRY